jgi:hypothetical protein
MQLKPTHLHPEPSGQATTPVSDFIIVNYYEI